MAPISPTIIANTALQHCGEGPIAPGSFPPPAFALFTENSKNAKAVSSVYDLLRRRELRRNVWRFSIKEIALRAVNLDTQFVTFGTWAIGTTYALNDVVIGPDNQVWISIVPSNLGNQPDQTLGYWRLYVGPKTATQYTTTFSLTQAYNQGQYALGSNGVTYVSLVNNNYGNDPTVTPYPTWSSLTSYHSGNIVLGSDSNTYQSVINTNLNNNPVGDNGSHWAQITAPQSGPFQGVNTIGWAVSTTPEANNAYYAGELVYVLGATTVYQSQTSQNVSNPLTDTLGNWITFTTPPTLAALNFIYPIGTGPMSDRTTRNVFQLPHGFVREAPQAPKASVGAFLGGPAGLPTPDWYFEGDYITSSDSPVIVFRMAGDIADPTQFDPMFAADVLPLAIALQVCEPLTQSGEKLQGIEGKYKKFVFEARTVNGIETGSDDPPLDEYIVVRS